MQPMPSEILKNQPHFEIFLCVNRAAFRFRKGRVSAISATAVRKLAVIIWNMVTKGQQYINHEGYLYLAQKRKLGLVKRIKKQIAKFELKIKDFELPTS